MTEGAVHRAKGTLHPQPSRHDAPEVISRDAQRFAWTLTTSLSWNQAVPVRLADASCLLLSGLRQAQRLRRTSLRRGLFTCTVSDSCDAIYIRE